jgi:hypothetical protein
MEFHETLPQNGIELDGEVLARAYPNPHRFKKLVELLRHNGVSDADIVRAMARAKTVISALRVIR